jgi:predicted DNA-binding ribbon-helix-helix protein
MSVLKRSIIISGHKTSVSMEDPFWNAFREAAKARGLTLSEFAGLIDGNRDPDTNLSSAIRLQVFADARKNVPPARVTQALEALHEAREQVSILQQRLGIVDRGGGTLAIVGKAIAALEAQV